MFNKSHLICYKIIFAIEILAELFMPLYINHLFCHRIFPCWFATRCAKTLHLGTAIICTMPMPSWKTEWNFILLRTSLIFSNFISKFADFRRHLNMSNTAWRVRVTPPSVLTHFASPAQRSAISKLWDSRFHGHFLTARGMIIFLSQDLCSDFPRDSTLKLNIITILRNREQSSSKV